MARLIEYYVTRYAPNAIRPPDASFGGMCRKCGFALLQARAMDVVVDALENHRCQPGEFIVLKPEEGNQ
jgi:hypothetical protein